MAILNNCNIKDTLLLASTDKEETYNVAEYLEGLQSYSHCIYKHKCDSGYVYRMGHLCWFHNEVMITALPKNTLWQTIPEGYRPMESTVSTDSLISSNTYMGTVYEEIQADGKFYLVTDKPNTTVEVHIDMLYLTQDEWPDSSEIIESTKGHAIPNDLERASLINAMKWKLIGTATGAAGATAVSVPKDDIIINELCVLVKPTSSDIFGSYVFTIPYNYLTANTEDFKQGAYCNLNYYSECIIRTSNSKIIFQGLKLTNGNSTQVSANALLSVYYR